MSSAFAVAVGLTFVAELGDKTQLLTFALAARYRWRTVAVGVALGAALLMAVSVAAGRLLGSALPQRPLELAAGTVFLLFAAWTLWRPDADEGTADGRAGGVLGVLGAFVLAELGDKTMLTAIALATTRDPIGTWAGATTGLLAANVVPMLLGDRLGTVLPAHRIRVVAAALFAVFGVLLLLGVGPG